MQAIRYRTGTDEATGKLLSGWPHVEQSLRKIWTTRTGLRVMRLDFGSELRAFLGEDITPALALDLYDALVTAAHAWEPEYRIRGLQLVHLTRLGSLGLRHSGTYYPEGRFGNYEIAFDAGSIAALQRFQNLGRAA